MDQIDETKTRNRGLILWWHRLRLYEALLMCGFPLFGFLYAWKEWRPEKLGRFFIFFCGVMLLSESIYLFNKYSGHRQELTRGERFSDAFIREPSVELKKFRNISFLLFLAAILIFLYFSSAAFVFSIILFTVWAVYSHPATLLKATAIGSVFTHIVSGILQFLLGAAFVVEIASETVMLSVFFAMIFTGGHLVHEVKDREEDSKLEVHNKAFRYGPKKLIDAAYALFMLSSLYLAFLYIFEETLPSPFDQKLSFFFVAVFFFVPVILLPFYLRVRKSAESRNAVMKYRSSYRLLYSLAGLAAAAEMAVRRL